MDRHVDEPTEERGSAPPGRGWLTAQRALIAVAVILLIVFAAANFKSVEVNFLLFTAEARVVTVILVAGLLGFVVGYLLGRPSRSERKRLRRGDEKD